MKCSSSFLEKILALCLHSNISIAELIHFGHVLFGISIQNLLTASFLYPYASNAPFKDRIKACHLIFHCFICIFTSSVSVKSFITPHVFLPAG
jgi:hypothetical protein